MILDIKQATTIKTKCGNLLTFGVGQTYGGNGTPDVPSGGGREYVFFKLNHREVESETWNQQKKRFEKLQRQINRLRASGQNKCRTEVQDNKY